MIKAICKDWWEFKRLVCDGEARRPREEQQLFWFRGQSDARWELKTTLDRAYRFKSARRREAFAADLLQEFRRQSVGLGFDFADLEGEALELLARHYGLPSPILDWTESPYVAAYFAYEGAYRRMSKSGSVAIWVWSRDLYFRLIKDFKRKGNIEIIDDPALLKYNPRAVQQQSVFMRMNTAERVDGVTRYLLPASDAPHVIADLAAMNITARNLFRDLEGAVKTATAKVRP
jgi:hypothetical protein